MIIGRMNWRITLLQPVKTPDGMGGYKTSYQPAGKVWAEFRNPNVKEMTAVGTVVSDLVRLISIRRRTDIQRGWRVQTTAGPMTYCTLMISTLRLQLLSAGSW